MAIQYVGGQVGGRAGSTSTTNITFSLTGGLASTPSEGDLILIGVMVGTQGRNPSCAISGYSTVGTQLNVTSTTYDTSLQVSYLFAGATPPTTFTLPSTGNIADAQSYVVQVWRGVDSTTPFDVASVSNDGTATTRANPASITPTTSGAVVVAMGGGCASTAATYTSSDLSAFLTNRANDTNDSSIGGGYIEWTSGAVDPAAWGGGNVNAANSWASLTIALRPAPASVAIDVPNASLSLTGYAPTVEATDLPRLYYVIYASAGSEPSATQIKAGQNSTGSAATAAGDEVARQTTGEQVFATAASGLSASTGYKVSFVWSDGSTDSNVATSAEFTTLGAGTTVSVPAASLSLAGQAPTVVATANVWIDVAAASLALTAFAPTVSATAHVWVEPPSGSLALAAYAPTVATTANVAVEVPAASLSVAGQTPDVVATANVWIEAPSASLSAQGHAPSVLAGASVAVDVPSASLALAGFAPTIDATADVWIEVPVAGLTVNAQTPTVAASANVWIDVPSAAIGATAYAPSVLAGGDAAIQVPAAALAIAGFAPTVIAGGTVVRKRGGGVTVRLAGELRWFPNIDELYEALDEFEEVSEDRAKRKAEIVAKAQPKASPKRIAKRAPRVQVVESEIDLGPVMARVERANRRVREAYESEARAAMLAVYLDIEMRVRDDEAAIVSLMF